MKRLTNSEGGAFRPEARNLLDMRPSSSAPVFSRPHNTADADPKYKTHRNARQTLTSGYGSLTLAIQRPVRANHKKDNVEQCLAGQDQTKTSLMPITSTDRSATGRCWWCEYPIPLEAGHDLCDQCRRWAAAGARIGEAAELLGEAQS